MAAWHIPDALAEIWKLVGACNKYIDVTAPWILARSDDGKVQLTSVLYNLAEALRVIAVLLTPFLTSTPQKIFAQLGTDESLQTLGNVAWGGTRPGTRVHKGEALFPRIDIAKELAELEAEAAAKEMPQKPQGPAPIDYADFEKIDLRLAKVAACEEIPKAKKLLKLSLELDGETRTVVSGIKKWYAPEDLVGKTVVLVANLKPVTLCGVESHGMILCASDEADETLSVVTTLSELPSGLKVR